MFENAQKKANDEFESSEAEMKCVQISGAGLTIAQAFDVAHGRAQVELTSDIEVARRVDAAHRMMQQAANNGDPIYGVTTSFGGMSDVTIPVAEIDVLQSNMLHYHKAGLGRYLPIADVRAAMLLRANSHLRGASGIRWLLIERLQTFLNEGVTPCVPELGSIGASGDLVPLCYIAGALIGHEAGYLVDFKGTQMPARKALEHLGLLPLKLQPKEALAMLNGTSVMTGIAANCVQEARDLVALALQVHALFIQGLVGTNLSFHSFIHQHKPHPGQVWAAEKTMQLLDGSALVRDGKNGHDRSARGLAQDRYSIRCLPQYLGPVIEGLREIAGQIETEMNSANDNPLIDVDSGGIFYGGNFLGQYIGVGMDRLRFLLGLVAKHIDVQIAMLVSPEFSNGLPPSLVGNPQRNINAGLKGLQIVGNSIMPLLQFLGNSLSDRYPTHAEQYNQNINSQGFGSANLARQSIDLFRKYLSLSLIFAVQAADLRSFISYGSYDGGQFLSPKTRALYLAVRELTQTPAMAGRPWLWNDGEHALDEQVTRLEQDLAQRGLLLDAVLKNVNLADEA